MFALGIRLKTLSIENGKTNGFEDPQYKVLQGSLTDKVSGRFDIIAANIVADIIIRMMPDVGALMDENSVILASGIIVERSEDVISGFEEHGFKIVERIDENGWCALAVMKA